jgi:Domain of unknown function (DUF4190)
MTSDQPEFGQGPFSGPPAEQTQYGSAPAYGGPQYGQAMPYARAGRGTNALAITALCCSIGQIILGPLAGIAALITGFMALGQISRTGEDGRGMAITGLVLGIVGLILFAVVVVLALTVWNRVTS